MKYTIPIFFLLFSIVVSAQNEDISVKIDALKEKISQSTTSERLNWLDSLSTLVQYKTEYQYDSLVTNTITHAYLLDSLNIAINRTADLIYYKNNIIGKPTEGLEILEKFGAKDVPLKDNYSLARLYLNGADSYFFTDRLEEALDMYRTSKLFAVKAKNDRLLGFANLYEGQTLESLGNFAEASQNYRKAYNYFSIVKDTFNIISSKNSLSILYSKNGFYGDAQKERDEYIALLQITNNYDQLATSYFNASIDYFKLGMPEKQNDNLLKALEFCEKSERSNFIKPTILNTLIIANAQNNNLDAAEKYLKEVESNLEQNTKGRNNNLYKEALMHMAFKKENYKEALKIGKELLDYKIKKREPEDIERVEKFISEIYENLGDSKNSLIHLKKHIQLKDSIKSVQKVNVLSYYQTLYETEKRDSKIKEQRENINLLNAQNKSKTQWFIFTSTGLVSLFVFIFLVRSKNIASKKRKLQEQFTQDLIKVKENESTRLARELHDSIGQKMMLLTKKVKSCGIQDMNELADSTLEELRNISKNLYPSIIEQVGITSAIIGLIDEVDAHTSLFFTNDIDTIDGLLNKETNLHVYRILQELLSNCVKHAKATTIFVTLKKKENSITLTVIDNGKGFDFIKAKETTKSLGMNTIFERAKIIHSKLKINAEFGKGTKVKLVIPL
ncbi:MAG: hypothetical protein HKP59_10820 [Lutibacter sp.]|uniref:tetratricopeptide repeat-containing sensor histidine kinase n=1 Tax=Lutibacter sp. TaxID=1925666 RepID=UPI0017B4D1EA|nr:ATP-binding protein [Lutibacter sp.]MBT8318103.1 hypothetical protein [Lutibacter sp.]NNJ58963.1 hypothetical protein [Lutibacter sp.]